jgi:hypothetical protein
LDKVPSSPSHSEQAPAYGCSTPAMNSVRMPVSTERKRNVSLTPRTRANYKSYQEATFLKKEKKGRRLEKKRKKV